MQRCLLTLILLVPGCIPVEDSGTRAEANQHSSNKARPADYTPARRFLVTVSTHQGYGSTLPKNHRTTSTPADGSEYAVIRIPTKDAPESERQETELLLWPNRSGYVKLPDGKTLALEIDGVSRDQGWALQLHDAQSTRQASLSESQLLWIGPGTAGADAPPTWAVTIRVEKFR